MADFFIKEVSFYVLSYLVGSFIQGCVPTFFQIIGYVSITEIFKLFILPIFTENARTEREDGIEENYKVEMEGKNIPIVRSFAVFKMCEGLDISARLAPMEEINNWKPKDNLKKKELPNIIKKEQKKETNLPPQVRNVAVYKMCLALGLEAELNPNMKTEIFTRKQKPIPVVQSTTVFMFCEALNLKATLARPQM
ncbi:hypothetical protein TNIN_139901 [Trichonephila inaurata madagascariensis]|uniref:Uncharacterized protein n=1 Tax=Trichonephila inaurata madagascariensis TaxID=2747483 RepID=A0A8X6XU39_9ARAC|nr:hypothetical protein TNIN_139901 [Trichonephila inaurata madagascariensis]